MDNSTLEHWYKVKKMIVGFHSNRSGHKGLVFIITVLCVAVLTSACQVCRVSSTVSSIQVTNLGVCRGIGSDGQPEGISDRFPAASQRIYAFFTLDSKMPIRLKTRWYYEDELILEYEDLYQPGLSFSWIERQGLPSFRTGMYTVEVAGHAVQFRVEQDVNEGDSGSNL